MNRRIKIKEWEVYNLKALIDANPEMTSEELAQMAQNRHLIDPDRSPGGVRTLISRIGRGHYLPEECEEQMELEEPAQEAQEQEPEPDPEPKLAPEKAQAKPAPEIDPETIIKAFKYDVIMNAIFEDNQGELDDRPGTIKLSPASIDRCIRFLEPLRYIDTIQKIRKDTAK